VQRLLKKAHTVI